MGYHLMRKMLFLIVLSLLVLPTAVGARNLFEVGLGVSGIYNAGGALTNDTFIDGMGDGDNWTIGIGLNSRLSIVNLSLLAVIPQGGSSEEEAFGLRTSLSFDIPLVTDRLYVHAGAGLSTDFSYGGEDDSGATVNGRAIDATSFGDAVYSSHVHLKAGIDVLFGWAKLGLFYIFESTATVETLEAGSWSDLLQSQGSDRLGLMVQLAVF